MNLRKRIEEILKAMLNDIIRGTFEPTKYENKKIDQATDQILQVTNKGRLPCEHLTFKTQNGKIVDLFIDNEEWKPASPKKEKG